MHFVTGVVQVTRLQTDVGPLWSGAQLRVIGQIGLRPALPVQKFISAFEQSSNEKYWNHRHRSKLFGTFEVYFQLRVRNLNDTPVISSVKLISFPDGCPNSSIQFGAKYLGFGCDLQWTVCWTLYSRHGMLSSMSYCK
ncbi:unnamed protein product [Larinioides sclopetarius]|uniref:Uncharacterized protein n=1 Tax=Larinioides sclopetarius TaxID=280406 RepID=A0AAV2B3X6_9ARAC